MPGPHFTPGKDPVPILQKAVWVSGSVWTGAENLVPTGIRSPDRPALRQSLYRLRYLVHSSLDVRSQNLLCKVAGKKQRQIAIKVNYVNYLWVKYYFIAGKFTNLKPE
jgi:hypothetical protein